MPPDAATWTDRGLCDRLAGTRFGDVRWFDRIDSTNRYVLAAAREGTSEGLVAVADEQTSGRGRLGRRWESPPGASLLVSVLLRPTSASVTRVTMATALALATALEAVAAIRVGLKWPNDLIVEDRKLAGILAESDGAAIVVGVGCNVNWGEIPPDLDGIATSCDLEVGRRLDRVDLLARFLRELDGTLDALDGVAEAYRERLDTIGHRVRVERPDGDLVGRAVDLDDDGALVVVTDDGRRTSVHVGDVIHLRPDPSATS